MTVERRHHAEKGETCGEVVSWSMPDPGYRQCAIGVSALVVTDVRRPSSYFEEPPWRGEQSAAGGEGHDAGQRVLLVAAA